MKMHVPIRKPQPWVWKVTLVCLFFGGFIAFLYNAMTEDLSHIDTTQLNREQLLALYTKTLEDNRSLQKDNDTLRTQLNNITNTITSSQQLSTVLQKQIDDLRIRAGVTPVKGPGIFIVLDDTGIKSSPLDPDTLLRIVHDSDLLTLVNELHSAGAEAIDINGQRVVGSTAIRCAGPVIQVNGTQVAAPFQITAIGNMDTLYGAVNLPNGPFDWLRPMGIRVEVTKREESAGSGVENSASIGIWQAGDGREDRFRYQIVRAAC